MKRQEFIDKLKAVAPAISSNPIVPLLTTFWFTGTQLLAYNDQIALAVPLRTAFKGAISEKLLHLLEASGFEDMDLAVEDNILMVKRAGGKTAIKLAMMAPEFLFTMPEVGGSIPQRQIGGLVRAIDHCLMSVGTDTSKPEYLGVTVVAENGRLTAYATDGNTISRARVKDIDLPRAILPGEFCRQLVSLYGNLTEEGGESLCSFAIQNREEEQYALFTTDTVALYGRIIATSSPLNFAAVLANLVPSRSEDLVEIPEQFNGAVDRAMIVCDHDRGHTTIKIADGKMLLHSQVEGAEDVKDELTVSRNHPPLTIKVEPRLLKRGASFDRMLIKASCVIMAKGAKLYLIAGHD